MKQAPVEYRAQRGMTMIVVLVLMAAMLLGGLAMAKITESGLMVSGNLSIKERAIQASEVGVNTAFRQIQALSSEDTDAGNWYFASMRNLSPDGLPANVDWDKVPSLDVGTANTASGFKVQYVVERLCSVATVTDAESQCLLKQVDDKQNPSSAKAGVEALDPPSGKQYRVTVRVSGDRNTLTVVQTLVTRG